MLDLLHASLHQVIQSFDFSLFILLIWYITLIDFQILNQACIPGTTHLVIVYNSIYVLLNLVC